jgi:hypothetical protein
MSHRQTRMERAKAQPSPHRLSIPIFAIFRHLAAACAKKSRKDLLFLALAGAGDSLVLTCEL